MKVYFVGIGGISMSGIARYMQSKGYAVAGSDSTPSELVKELEREGIQIFAESDLAGLVGADLLIYTSAAPASHPLRQKADELGILCIRRIDALSQLCRRGMTVGIAGTHGKTSTTTMLAHILRANDVDITAFIGGESVNYASNIICGDDRIFVMEADEYDRSLLALYPVYAGVTGIEADHLDIYKDLDDIKATFKEYMRRVPFFGKLVINADCDATRLVAKGLAVSTLTVGFSSNADYQIINFEEADFNISYDLIINNNSYPLNIPVLGKFNAINASLAVTIAIELGVAPHAATLAMQTYLGVRRRFEKLGTINGATVYDDYAHHPSEIMQTLQAVRANTNKQIVAVFEPHLFSRTLDFYREFASALLLADQIVLMPIYPAREKSIAGVTSGLIAKEIADKQLVKLLAGKAELFKFFDTQINANQLVIGLGAGTISSFLREYLAGKNKNAKSV